MLSSLEAIPLSKEKLGEIDLLVEFLTPEGKLWCVAKGGQKSKRRFLNALEDLNILKIYTRKPKKGELPILEKAEILFIPEKPRYDYESYIFSCYITEVISKVSYPELRAEHFEITKKFIKLLENKSFSLILKPMFELKLLTSLGWKPELERCVRCGYPPRKIFFLSIKDGGAVCYRCKGERDEFLEKGVIDILKFLIKMPLRAREMERVIKETLNSQKIFSKVFKITEDFLKFYIDSEISSLKFFNGVGNGKIS